MGFQHTDNGMNLGKVSKRVEILKEQRTRIVNVGHDGLPE
jgi:hypothetical protein